ncbi:MAG: pyruvate, phosphate dikinase, partial [Bacteriovoracaceae bacterium]
GKGANLGQMTKLGLPIPQGFTVSTEACTFYYENNKKLSAEIIQQVEKSMSDLEKITGKKFGDPTNPLLVSVRSGARASMPGMMDTILNLGLNDEVVLGLENTTGNPKFARDSYRRFIQMYSDVVMGLSKTKFEEIIEEMKEEKKVASDMELTAEDFQELIQRFKKFYRKQLKQEFPIDPKEQLFGAITAVFNSWDNPRANYYRKMHNIPYEWGTAVNVQSMVYGNMGNDSGTGVSFTRNPATGENLIFGEYLINAQGEDVVAGIRTPNPIAKLKEEMPEVYHEFALLSKKLETHYKDMQDIEFTIEKGKLYLLQTRNGKRTADAALRIAVEMVEEGLIDKKKAIMLVQPEQLDTLLHPQFDSKILSKTSHIGEGLPASPGAASGEVVFNVKEALESTGKGKKVVLVRLETSPEDIEGMHVSEGFLTARGGMTSHAAVVARGMGKCCVSGVSTLDINEEKGYFKLGGQTISKGDYISLDGSTGRVYAQKIPTVPAKISGNFEKFMKWCDDIRILKVRANADTPKDALQALEFGAEGIGLCRTEHMFFDSERINIVREFILADTTNQRKKALDKLLPVQRKDFEEIFEAMKDNPVTIRYLDPPLHEFLPSRYDIAEVAKELGVSADRVRAKITELHEFNPMMGHRGCRLSVSYPELAEMQTRAVLEAYINVKERNPEYKAEPEIMIPLIGDELELKFVKDIVVKTANEVIKEKNAEVRYTVGTMIEIPRACIRADYIAEEAEFFSFGTNDLTQMTFGFSRDDAGSFLNNYYEKRIYTSDPFARLDQNGVGTLVKMAVEKGKSVRPNLKLGVCGEHGGEPSSIEFFHKVGLDYVSCSPYRVPIARLAAAQSVVKENQE